LILYGNLSGQGHETMFPLLPAVARGLSMRGYLLLEVIQDESRLAPARRFVEEGLRAGTLKPIIAKTFTLDGIVEAHRYLESNQQFGKIVVTVPDAGA
jgi:NADPH:quinone reductase-like Zn-dependent oxidoreductase